MHSALANIGTPLAGYEFGRRQTGTFAMYALGATARALNGRIRSRKRTRSALTLDAAQAILIANPKIRIMQGTQRRKSELRYVLCCIGCAMCCPAKYRNLNPNTEMKLARSNMRSPLGARPSAARAESSSKIHCQFCTRATCT